MLSLVTAPTAEPLSLVEAKAHCRVDVSDDDTLLTTLIVAARQYAESFTHRAIPAQTWDDKRDGFPCWYQPITLPFPPVTAITSVTYVATDGTSTVWSASNYTSDLPVGDQAGPGRVIPNYQVSWPMTRSVLNAVTVRFVAGYTTAPEAIKQAMKLLIGHWYTHRETVIVGTIAQELQVTVNALLWPYKYFHY